MIANKLGVALQKSNNNSISFTKSFGSTTLPKFSSTITKTNSSFLGPRSLLSHSTTPILKTSIFHNTSKAFYAQVVKKKEKKETVHESDDGFLGPGPALPPKDTSPIVYQKTQVLEGDSIQFTPENIGKVALFSAEELKKALPEGFNGRMDKDMEFIGHGKTLGIVIRKELVDIVQALQDGTQNMFMSVPYKLLTGPPGSGRSYLMASLALWARRNGFLVVNIPSGWKFVGGPYFIESKHRPDQWDQLEVAVKFLTAFYTAHQDKLKQIQLKLPFHVPEFNRTTLAELVQFGIKDKFNSGEVVYHLRKELSLVTEYPVLVLVDEYNALQHISPVLYDPTYDNLRGRPMPTDRMTCPKAFKDFQNHGLTNGTVIGAVSHLKYQGVVKNFLNDIKRLPTQDHVIEVPKFRKPEFYSLMNYYQEGRFFVTDVPGRTREWIYYVNDGIGSAIFDYVKCM